MASRGWGVVRKGCPRSKGRGPPNGGPLSFSVVPVDFGFHPLSVCWEVLHEDFHHVVVHGISPCPCAGVHLDLCHLPRAGDNRKGGDAPLSSRRQHRNGCAGSDLAYRPDRRCTDESVETQDSCPLKEATEKSWLSVGFSSPIMRMYLGSSHRAQKGVSDADDSGRLHAGRSCADLSRADVRVPRGRAAARHEGAAAW